MLLNIANENFRELLDLNNLPSDELSVEALRHTACSQIASYSVTYSQRVGSCIIFQSGTDADRAEFERAIEYAIDYMRKNPIIIR